MLLLEAGRGLPPESPLELQMLALLLEVGRGWPPEPLLAALLMELKWGLLLGLLQPSPSPAHLQEGGQECQLQHRPAPMPLMPPMEGAQASQPELLLEAVRVDRLWATLSLAPLLEAAWEMQYALLRETRHPAPLLEAERGLPPDF